MGVIDEFHALETLPLGMSPITTVGWTNLNDSADVIVKKKICV